MILLRLRGAHKGRTLTLHGVAFSNGLAYVSEEQAKLLTVLRRFYQALPDSEPDPVYEGEDGGDLVGSGEPKTDKKRAERKDNTVPGGVRSNGKESAKTPTNGRAATDETKRGDTGLETEGRGSADPRPDPNPEVMQMRSAILSMDPENDSFWTGDDQPNVKIVAGMISTPNLSRTKILTLAPDCDRDFVRKNGVRS